MNLVVLYKKRPKLERRRKQMSFGEDMFYAFTLEELEASPICGYSIDKLILRGIDFEDVPPEIKMCCSPTCSVSYG